MKVTFPSYSTSMAYSQINRTKTNKVSNPSRTNNSPTFTATTYYYNNGGVYIVLDGFGKDLNPSTLAKQNPFDDAKMPFYQSLINNKNGDTLYRLIEASGEYVGLPKGMVGNSEVGHNNLGAGRLVEQDLAVIDRALREGTFFSNEEFLNVMNHVKDKNSTLHITGLLSDGHVHSEIRHMEALVKMARENGVPDVRVHAFLDGRDVPEGTALKYISEMNKVLEENGYEDIASVIGMKYPMDRDQQWDMTEVAFNLLTDGRMYGETDNLEEYINTMYKSGFEDKDIPPIRLASFKPISDNDGVISANYRPDRMIQITDALTQKSCQAPFIRGVSQPKNLYYVCMSQYEPKFNLPVAFKPLVHTETLTEVLARNKYYPFLTTDNTKKAHLSFFFDGKRFMLADGTNRVFVPTTYPLKPEMSLPVTTSYLMQAMDDGFTKAFITNFANADMLGHEANYDKCVAGLEQIDKYLEKVVTKARAKGLPVLITADHGNIETLRRPDGSANGSHTNNPVPFILVLPGMQTPINKGYVRLNQDSGMALKDVTPTFLDTINVEKPSLMTGNSMLEVNKIIY